MDQISSGVYPSKQFASPLYTLALVLFPPSPFFTPLLHTLFPPLPSAPLAKRGSGVLHRQRFCKLACAQVHFDVVSTQKIHIDAKCISTRKKQCWALWQS
jgi:hypothetical protein